MLREYLLLAFTGLGAFLISMALSALVYLKNYISSSASVVEDDPNNKSPSLDIDQADVEAKRRALTNRPPAPAPSAATPPAQLPMFEHIQLDD